MTTRPQLTIAVRVIDVGAAKRYLRGLRTLCDEAIATSDDRVLQLALAVVADQRKTVARLRRGIEVFE